MIAALEKPAVRGRAVPLSRAAYHLMFENGLIGEKTELPKELIVQQEQPLGLLRSEPEPDIAIVDAATMEDMHEHAAFAHLVVEVSNTTLRLDRAKAGIYAQAGIPRYLILNLEARQVEEFLSPIARAIWRRKYILLASLRSGRGLSSI
jgi:hypothetical protein